MTDKVSLIRHLQGPQTDDQFSTLLSETINAPRLSGTKVKTLTELFTTSLDLSHVTTFYKLNRSLPQGGQARISSLYVFDALSRGAKEWLKGKKKAEAKRCLDALEAVAESWVEGMTTFTGQTWVEGKVRSAPVIRRRI
jgi:protein NRD1